ncbi:MAG TPA: metallophosphoesterase, partial [Anaerolineales bacterium]
MKRWDWSRMSFSPMPVLAGLGTLGGLAAAYGYWVEPFWFKRTRLNIPFAGLDRRMDGFRILQISDIHIAPWMMKGYLRRIADSANRARADVIALTGDYFFDPFPGMYPALEEFVAALEPRLVKLAILGNHDHWTDPVKIRAALERSGCIDLSNRTIEVGEARCKIIIAGLDDPWEGKDELETVLPRIPDGEKAVLLVHEPDYARKYARTR